MQSGQHICAAIDIGNTYSGCVFTSKHDYIERINIKTYEGHIRSSKTPTAILLDRGQYFRAFGYDAEAIYSQLVAEGEHEEYYYFHKFKTILYDKTLSEYTTIKDETRKEMNALRVFSHAIRFLKDDLHQYINDNFAEVTQDEIHYVLTVPAIWESLNKKFLKEAAILMSMSTIHPVNETIFYIADLAEGSRPLDIVQANWCLSVTIGMAGITSNQLSIVLDPEAVSIYCRNLKTNEASIINKSGMKYMVVDLGGTSTEITVYVGGKIIEVLLDNFGNSLEKSFHAFLDKLFGPLIMHELMKTSPQTIATFLRECEVKSQSIRYDKNEEIILTLPDALCKLDLSFLEQDCTRVGDTLHVSSNVVKNVYKSAINALILHLEKLFRKEQIYDVENIILVGGYSNCQLVQQELKEKFGKQKKIIIPFESNLAVLKGAVLYGQNVFIPTIVSKRTYGMAIWQKWDPRIHPESKKVTLGGVTRCKDVFCKFLERGEAMDGSVMQKFRLQLLNPSISTFECTIYVSEDKDPQFTTDPSCHRLLEITIDLQGTRSVQALELEMTMIFCGAEFKCRVVDAYTGEPLKTKICL